MISYIQRKRNKKGFTLIELVVVIAILGILAALAIPRLSGSTQKAKETTNEANIRTIQSAISLYEAENGDKPTSIDDLIPKYLDKVPVNPLTEKDPGYSITVSGDTVTINEL